MQKKARNMNKMLLGSLLALAISLATPISAKSVENCPEFNLSKIFYFGYSPDFPKWNVPGVKRVITWTTLDTGELNFKKIQKSFDARTKDWLREAFKSWDDALDSISFQEVTSGEAADIKIGWTQVLQLDYESIFNVKVSNGFRSEATIEFKSQSTFLIFKENFLQAAQSDIGHILGMGYISPSSELVSVMEWPFQAPYMQVPLGIFDVGLIRAIYSESTCPSTFSPVIQSKIKEQQEAEFKAKQEAEFKAKEEADARVALELKAKQEAENKAAAEKLITDAKNEAERILAEAKLEAGRILAEARTYASNKTTIICVKGTLTKKVSAVKPKCPSGYKKK